MIDWGAFEPGQSKVVTVFVLNSKTANFAELEVVVYSQIPEGFEEFSFDICVIATEYRQQQSG